jgi:hypothetical protein
MRWICCRLTLFISVHLSSSQFIPPLAARLSHGVGTPFEGQNNWKKQ